MNMTLDKLTKVIMSEFTTHFASDAECFYLRDSKENVQSSNVVKLKELGFCVSEESKMPDVILYSVDKDWLYLIQSVVNSDVIDEIRFEELKTLTRSVDKQKVFITAFPNSQSFKDNMDRLAWDTVAWIADTPEHMIHFEKHGTLEPR